MAKLPPKDPRDIGPQGKVKQRSVGLPIWMWKAIDETCERDGYTGSELFRVVLKQFIDDRATDVTVPEPQKKTVGK